jgi:hypothetical protein
MPIQRLLAFSALVLVTTTARAGETASAPPRNTSSATHSQGADVPIEPLPLGSGLLAFIDPATGRLRQPTSQELAGIAAASRTTRNKSIEGLEVEYRTDGSKHVDLQGRFMHSLRVVKNADGTTTFTCTDRDAHPHPGPATPAAPAEK